MKNNKGVTLVSMVIIIIVIVIISGISIIGGTDIISSSKDSKAQENLTAVKSVVNSIHLKNVTAGVFTPANSKVYGKTAYGILSGDANTLAGWYILDEEDLEEMSIKYLDENYLVNYEKNEVIPMSEYSLSKLETNNS